MFGPGFELETLAIAGESAIHYTIPIYVCTMTYSSYPLRCRLVSNKRLHIQQPSQLEYRYAFLSDIKAVTTYSILIYYKHITVHIYLQK